MEMSLNQQIEIGLIRPKFTEIRWHYQSKLNGKLKPCDGWDNGCNDALSYLKYGYTIKAVKK
jgi:hypothetical protein